MSSANHQPTAEQPVSPAPSSAPAVVVESVEALLKAKSSGARLGAVVRRLREDQELSISDLARRAGTSRGWLSKFEQGTFQDIQVAKLAKVVEALGTSADVVLHEAGYRTSRREEGAEPRQYLREVYGLKPKDLDLALGFLDFLEAKSAKPTKGT